MLGDMGYIFICQILLIESRGMTALLNNDKKMTSDYNRLDTCLEVFEMTLMAREFSYC